MFTVPRTVTQKDVAARAGLSRSMAAMALSGHPRIAEATWFRVLRAAEEVGCKPDLVDFDFINESLQPELGGTNDSDGPKLQVGEMAYETVLG